MWTPPVASGPSRGEWHTALPPHLSKSKVTWLWAPNPVQGKVDTSHHRGTVVPCPESGAKKRGPIFGAQRPGPPSPHLLWLSIARSCGSQLLEALQGLDLRDPHAPLKVKCSPTLPNKGGVCSGALSAPPIPPLKALQFPDTQTLSARLPSVTLGEPPPSPKEQSN